jgi:hypothetical protein
MSFAPSNALRFRTDLPRGHVESYFVRANHPTKKLAIWLKATVFAPRGHEGVSGAVAELWCIVFQGDAGRVWAGKRTVPFAEASFLGEGPKVRLAGAELDLGPKGRSVGALEGEGGPCRWDLRWEADASPMGRPMLLLPSEKLLDDRIPTFKTVTPRPLLRMSGAITVAGETLDVDGWWGMEGHNWARQHAWDYAWGQCVFLDDSGSPTCVAEGFSGKVRVGGVLLPYLSTLVVRRGAREYRFDGLVDPWRQDIEIDDLRWTARLRSKDGEALLRMEADAREMACLGYPNPDGRTSYCFNSKLARTHLRVNPVNEEGFEVSSAHGGALELLHNTRDPRFPKVV